MKEQTHKPWTLLSPTQENLVLMPLAVTTLNNKPYIFFFITRLPPEFLPASGPSEQWCDSTPPGTLVFEERQINYNSEWSILYPERDSNLGPKRLSLLEFETWWLRLRLRPLGHHGRFQPYIDSLWEWIGNFCSCVSYFYTVGNF